MAERYGSMGREAYMRISLTLDILIPLVGSLLLTSILVFLIKKLDKKNYAKYAVGVGILICISDWISVYPFEDHIKTSYNPKGDTIIGNDVWIGMDAMIMPGVKIGDGAIIGARSVVAKDVEPYSVVCGNPAKEVKKRFTIDEINKLLEIRWYDWDIEEIKSITHILSSGSIDKLYNYYKNRLNK